MLKNVVLDANICDDFAKICKRDSIVHPRQARDADAMPNYDPEVARATARRILKAHGIEI